MTHTSEPLAVYLEVGKKRTLAGALDWPGWCRAGRNEEVALRALFEYGARYGLALEGSGLDFLAPQDPAAYKVVERLEGNTTTDFGAPDVAPSVDSAPAGDAELERLKKVLQACWSAFDAAVAAADGKELRKGPRGGGREIDAIVRHVRDAETSYVSRLGVKLRKPQNMASDEDAPSLEQQRRQAVLEALDSAAQGEFPAYGPRGGVRWTPRFFVRRAAWHILDHAWELHDRSA